MHTNYHNIENTFQPLSGKIKKSSSSSSSSSKKKKTVHVEAKKAEIHIGDKKEVGVKGPEIHVEVKKPDVHLPGIAAKKKSSSSSSSSSKKKKAGIKMRSKYILKKENRVFIESLYIDDAESINISKNHQLQFSQRCMYSIRNCCR